MDGEVSNRKSIFSGVPHRSILECIIFLMYVNDLDDDITARC